MSEAAKSARKAMKDKIARIISTDPHRKVDASSWTPPEPLDTTAKTGMRPISRRQYKRGGKVVEVTGADAKQRADRKSRAKGGEAAVKGEEFMNRDYKSANKERHGIKHIGGMKRGGASERAQGGAMTAAEKEASKENSRSLVQSDQERAEAAARQAEIDRQNAAAAKAAAAAAARAPQRKRGGKADWEGSAKDEAQDKKLAKKHGMSMDKWEKSAFDEKHDSQQSMRGLKKGGRAGKEGGGFLSNYANSGLAGLIPTAIALTSRKKDKGETLSPGTPGKKSGGSAHGKGCTCKACGGASYKASGGSLDGSLQGTRPTGGRLARKHGGKAGKGKTNINIIIGTGHRDQAPVGGQPVGGPPPLPPMPPRPPMAAPPVGGPPMPPPMPPPGAGGAPPMGAPPMGGAPLMRKAGGRTYRSYKDMDAGAGSGLGRLEKTEIQKHKR